MADFLLKHVGTTLAAAAVPPPAPAPGKQTQVGGGGVPAITASAIERVRARTGEKFTIGRETFEVASDGSFRAASGDVIAPRGNTASRWIRIALRFARIRPKTASTPPLPAKPAPHPAAKPATKPKVKQLAPKLSASAGRTQFWKAVKAYAELPDPKARARWERIRNKYDASVHPLLEARMQEVVRGLTRAQRAELKKARPGLAIRYRDAQHVVGEHLVNTGVVAAPELGPNNLTNFVIGDLATNRKIQRELEVAAGDAARKATAAGGDPKRAGADAAGAKGKTRGSAPGMNKLAAAEARVAAKAKASAGMTKLAEAEAKILARRPPAVPKITSLKLRAPGGLARLRAGGRAGIGMLVQILVGWLMARQIEKLQQDRLDQELSRLLPSIEAATAARAEQLAALWSANPNADIYLTIRLAYDIETERTEAGMFDIVLGARLLGVEFTLAPADDKPVETRQHHMFGWITTTSFATSTKVDLSGVEVPGR